MGKKGSSGSDQASVPKAGKAKSTNMPPSEQPLYLRDKTLSRDDFELGKTLGTGSFGRVRFVTYNKGNAAKDFYALKILKKSAIIRLKQVHNHGAVFLREF